MQYISSRGEATRKSFSQILMAGAAEDGGLYMPEHWPQFSRPEIAGLQGASFQTIAFTILKKFAGNDFSNEKLHGFCDAAYGGFRAPEICPLRKLEADSYLLELFHGSTFAFKDVAMQMLAQMVGDELTNNKRQATIVCATSGDTGAAAVNAFGHTSNITVIVLFPDGRISNVQRRQMTASGAANILPLAVQGHFDDAQALVKELFADHDFSNQHKLTSVNSINFARIAAQVSYYFSAALALGCPDNLSFCVPTGNFGDIFAGHVAQRMGLPIKRLVIATNQNDILVRALETGIYEVENVVATTSPSMDIQVSSNFERVLFELSGRDSTLIKKMMLDLKAHGKFEIPAQILQKLRDGFAAAHASEDEVKAEIKDFYGEYNAFIDPHTAVGLVAARKCASVDEIMVTLSTAHPAKFSEAVKAATGQDIVLPPALLALAERPEHYETIAPDSAVLKQHIAAFNRKHDPA